MDERPNLEWLEETRCIQREVKFGDVLGIASNRGSGNPVLADVLEYELAVNEFASPAVWKFSRAWSLRRRTVRATVCLPPDPVLLFSPDPAAAAQLSERESPPYELTQGSSGFIGCRGKSSRQSYPTDIGRLLQPLSG